MKRRDVIAAALGAAVLGSTRPAFAQPPANEDQALSRDSGALVLPGGGARGAYEAGVIEGIRQRAGVGDGARLPGFDIVVGTSIGAINGWFVATGQYSLLSQLWGSIASEHIFEVKKQFRATVTPSSGVFTRIWQAALISQGLTTDVTGLLDGSRVLGWLERNVDPKVPVLVPYAFTLTNLNHQQAEVFYRLPFGTSKAGNSVANRRLRSLFGKRITTREFADKDLALALAGSSAIPIVLDPVTIEFDDGPQTYIDGGVADSAPIDIARAVSRKLSLILVDPAVAGPAPHRNAGEVGSAAFGIAQNRVLEASLRSAYLETAGKHLFDNASLSAAQRAYFENVFDVEISLIRPAQGLELEVAGFDDAEGIAKTYELGRQAGLKGFAPYDLGTALG